MESHSESKTFAKPTVGRRSINHYIHSANTVGSIMPPYQPPSRNSVWKFNFQSRGATPNTWELSYNPWEQSSPGNIKEGEKMLWVGNLIVHRSVLTGLILPPTQSDFLLHVFLAACNTQTCIRTILTAQIWGWGWVRIQLGIFISNEVQVDCTAMDIKQSVFASMNVPRVFHQA